jgi:signal transduction histidine kinase
MKIREKLATGFALLALLGPASVTICLHVAQMALQRAIGESSAVLAKETLDKIERGIWRRLEQAQLYAHALRYDEALLDNHFKFDKLRETEKYIEEVDRQWVAAVADGNSPAIMAELSENDLARRLRFEMLNESFYRAKYGYPVFSEVFITNHYGATAAQTRMTSDFNHADELWWQEAYKNGSYVGEVEYDRDTESWAIDLAVRVNDVAGSPLGVVKFVLDADEIATILDEVRREIRYRGTDLILLSKDLQIIHSTDGRQDPNLLAESLRSRPAAEASESRWFVSRDHAVSGRQPSLIARARSRGHRDFKGGSWVLVVSHDLREVFAPVTRLRDSLLVPSLRGTFVALGLSLLISRSIAGRVQTLAKAAMQISYGSLDTPIPSESQDETGYLGDCFAKMTHRLQTTIETLRTEVAARQRAEQSLEAVNRSLAHTVLELTQANKELHDFTYAAAHDLKTPVRGIAMVAEWLLADCGDRLGPSGRGHVQLLLRRAMRSNRLIDSIQEYARASHIEDAPGRVDTQELVAEAAASVGLPSQVPVRVVADCGTIAVPRRPVCRVLASLIDNAVRYLDRTPGQGEIVVQCASESDSLRFSVTDNGPGIDARYHERIFGMFQTLSLRDETEAAGMGLCIARKIVESHGGRIWVESRPGEGSTFHFTWPQAQEKRADDARQLVGPRSPSTHVGG